MFEEVIIGTFFAGMGVGVFLLFMFMPKPVSRLFWIAIKKSTGVILAREDGKLDVLEVRGVGKDTNIFFKPTKKSEMMFEGDRECFYNIGGASIGVATELYARILNSHDMSLIAFADKTAIPEQLKNKVQDNEPLIVLKVYNGGDGNVPIRLVPLHKAKVLSPNPVTPTKLASVFDMYKAAIAQSQTKTGFDIKPLLYIGMFAVLLMVAFAILMTVIGGGGKVPTGQGLLP
ncbi:MAG: hypothetical protein J7K23_04185 [Thermoproteales archaeon]|nr:hypothetical protein [Thermoproteales archaeon]